MKINIKEYKHINNKKCIYYILLIGFTFIGTGAAYMVQLYRLFNYFDGNIVSLITGGLYYVLQAISIGIVAFIFSKNSYVAGGRSLPFAATITIFICSLISVLSTSSAVIISSGIFMNLAIGVLSGCYLTKLATDVPQQRRGVVFGVAYSLGSIGTWLLSLPMEGKFLRSNASLIFISALLIISLLFLLHLPSYAKKINEKQFILSGFDKKLIRHSAAVLFLLSLVYTLGFSFPLKSASDSIYIEFTRAFYAVGLIIAGIISDKSRRWGAICCVASLAFPFAALSLGSSFTGETIMWIFAYLFLGFFSVYRILVFSDISAKAGLPALAVLGLCAGRLGDAAGALGASLLVDIPLIIFSSITFAFVILLFFPLYQRIYSPSIDAEEIERQLLKNYSDRFRLSARELEILTLIVQGMSNPEIASALYITESTVKFHTGNIYKKTGLTNRSELIADYKLEKII